MYEVSDAYKEAIAKTVRRYYIDGTVTTKTGKEIEINDDTVMEGTLYVTNQCVNSSDFEYGAVYSAEAGMTIKSNVDRYEMYDAIVSFSFYLETSDGVYEAVPMGIYNVSTCTRSGQTLAITCYDRMVLLEGDLAEDTNGEPYDLLLFIAEKCGVELAQEREEIEALTNGTVLMTLYAERVETYRDAVSYIAHVLCGFAVFDRFGKLKICQYASETCWSIKAKETYSVSVSDFKTYFQAMKVRFVTSGNYQTYTRENTEMTDGLLYDMGDIPIIQGVEDFKNTVLDAAWQQLQAINYTPCEIESIGNPAIDLGDQIFVQEIGKKNEEIIAYVTYYDWQYRRKGKLKSAGGNPKLSSAKSKVSKQLTSMESNIDQKDVAVYTYTNAKKYTLTATETEIALLNYAVVSDVKTVFMMTIQLNMETDGYLVLRYTKDFVEIQDADNRLYLQEGDHAVTIMLYLSDSENTRHILRVHASTEYVESNTRTQAAELATLKNYIEAVENGETTYTSVTSDNTQPKGIIKPYGVRCALFGQGLAASERWDGTISASEDIGYITVEPLTILDVVDGVTLTDYDPLEVITDHTAYIEVVPLEIADFKDSIQFESEAEEESS